MLRTPAPLKGALGIMRTTVLGLMHSIIVLLLIGVIPLQLPITIRFSTASLNYWFFALVCMTWPITLHCFARSLKPRVARIVGAAIGIALSALPFILGLLAVHEALDAGRLGYDSSKKMLSEVVRPNGYFRLYLTNCGATCAYGLTVHREVETPMGIKFVWPLWSKYRTDSEASLRLSGTNTLQVLERGALIKSLSI